MIKLEKTEIYGWEAAIRGMRNPMNSWDKSDSENSVEMCQKHTDCNDCPGFLYCEEDERAECNFLTGAEYVIGPNDHKLMMKLAKGGPVHAKYRRMIMVSVDITAPLYWWKEFDTYKVGTVANSCSTMHKIAEKEFTLDDFSCEHLINSPLIESDPGKPDLLNMQAFYRLEILIGVLIAARYNYIKTKDKTWWWQMIQLLPTSYNQKRTVMLNYEVLADIYPSRKNHKLDCWHTFCEWIEKLPYSEIITGGEEDE